jgi:hypothetical protein
MKLNIMGQFHTLHNVVSSTPHHERDSNSQRLPPIAYVNYQGNRMLLNE